MVLLVGNYAADRQESMQRFGAMMLQGLRDTGVPAEMIQPGVRLGRITMLGGSVAKWLGYVDKYIFFPARLRRTIAAGADVVHICDHSNATYASAAAGAPLVITCHDLLAVRGGLGEATDTPASFTGRFLQRWILRGLGKADVIACASDATAADARRLVRQHNGKPRLELVELGLNFPYRRLPSEVVDQRLGRVKGLKRGGRFLLHVGSNLRRKNRDAIIRIFARVAGPLDAQLVFAGDLLNNSLRQEAREVGVEGRVVEVGPASNEMLEALYNRAFAFVYPSRFEGFGWPIIEAQACGCPVVCSATPPMGSIGGNGAQLRAPEDEEGFAQDLLGLADPALHRQWSERALENARRFTAARMIEHYRELYRSLAPPC